MPKQNGKQSKTEKGKVPNAKDVQGSFINLVFVQNVNEFSEGNKGLVTHFLFAA